MHLFNLVAGETREGYVLKALLDKLERIEVTLGDRVFDVIGGMYAEYNLRELLESVLAGEVSKEQAAKAIAAKEDDPKAVARANELLESALASGNIDWQEQSERAARIRERRLPPSYFERFFVDAIGFAGGQARKRVDGAIRVERSPDVLVARGRASSQTRRIAPSYERLTFEREVAMRPLREEEAALPQAELCGPGHPLFDALIAYVIERTEQVLDRGAMFEDPDTEDTVVIHHLTAEVVDDRELVRETLAAASERGDVFTVALPRTLYDLIPSSATPSEAPDLPSGLDDWARSHLFEAPFQEAKAEREREAGITEGFLEESFTAQLADVDRQILEAEEEVDAGIAGAQGRLRQAELAKEAHRQRRDERLAMTHQSGKVFRGSVRHLGTPLLIPTAAESAERVESKNGDRFADGDIEAIAVAEATRYEVEERGAHVESTEKDGCGFDLRSTKSDGDRRCIEVKGRAAVGLVELTWLEYQKSLELKDEYWLYVVLECASDRPRLYRVQNPAEKLAGAITPSLDVRYRIQPDPVIDAAEAAA